MQLFNYSALTMFVMMTKMMTRTTVKMVLVRRLLASELTMSTGIVMVLAIIC